MSTEEILQVLPVELDAMNDTDGKSIPIRLQEIRAVVNLLAEFVLSNQNPSQQTNNQ